MKFEKKLLRELAECGIGHGVDGCRVVRNELIDHTRWCLVYELVFVINDKAYLSTYRVGATESQDESPYEYEDDLIECQEVVAKEVKAIRWVAI